MPARTPQTAGSSITISDIYYVLFKHKWMILIFSALGIGAAAALYKLQPPPYVSEAKLGIRYVEDTKAPMVPTQDTTVRPTRQNDEGVLDTEASILTSLDVAAKAAEIVGPEKILGPGAGGSTNSEVAGMMIRKSLNVEVPRRGNALRVTYEHPDKTLVQPVLRAVIQTYYKKHVEYHKNLGLLDEFLTQETDTLRQSLAQTEEEIRKLKTKAGVVSLEESRRIYLDRYSRLRADLETAQADLSEREAALKELEKVNVAQTGANVEAGTNNVATATEKPSPELLNQYKSLLRNLDTAYRTQEDLLGKFTEENALVKAYRAQIDSLEAKKKEMEANHPRLHDEEASVSSARVADRRDSRAQDLTSQRAGVAALKAKVKTLTEQFEGVKADAGAIDDIEAQYMALQRKKEQQEKQYKYYSTSLDQLRVDSQLGAGKANINEIQSPSLPLRDMKPLQKKLAAAVFGGIGGGIGLAFMLELVLAQSVRKPTEIESNLDVPVFLTIPKMGRLANGARHVRALGDRPALPPLSDGNGGAVVLSDDGAGLADSNGDVPPWDYEHELHGYAEGLRDRLVTYFEVKGLKHKPKLVALTSCSRGAGVTTLAAGLAASLSETGEGNVLLVDLNMERGAAHPFYHGRPSSGLVDVLEGGQRPTTKVNDKLYMVHGGASDDRLMKVMPQRLAHLLPKLQQSDYDYIIFDMPPITQTSVTPRLAGYMDMMFVVVEAEKTNRDWLKKAAALLKQSNANVAAVLNKRREYAPRWLHQEF